jgi:type II secretory ATPase GspE/PulE/Tfp pilus assembly ATPase PilB-like protein/ActR/RegA family two-component response regulator
MPLFKDEWLIKPLLRRGVVTKEIIEEIAKLDYKDGQQYLSDRVVSLGYITARDLGSILEEMFSIPYADLENIKINKAALEIIPEEICRKYIIFPYDLDNSYITIAICDPMNLDAEKEVSYISTRMTKTSFSSKQQILEKLNEYYSPDRFIDDLANKISDSSVDELENVAAEEKEEEITQKIDASRGDAPIVRLVNSILNDAIDHEVSDIHIEPTEKKVVIRFRVDGILRQIMEVPKYAAPQVISRIKILSNLDIAETRKPQDGKAKVKKANASIDLRVSVIPTSYGEKVVIRILDSRNANIPFEKLGIIGENLKKLHTVLNLKQGIILATGPTGSGKTTTLYSALNRIKSGKTNIITIEDPIEYMIEGINQVQVNVKAGITFASALRSFLRQDPDVILVGEIRDCETAEISIQASLTGHLVLSTLHTNNAIETITRLVDIGVDRYKVGSALSAVIGQRLVRKLCSSCLKEKTPEFYEKALIPLVEKLNLEPKFFKSEGCPHCDSTGYKGRVGIYEILIINKDIRDKIISGALLKDIEAVAIQGGFKTFTMTGLQLITSGVTDINELSRVITIDTDIKMEEKADTQKDATNQKSEEHIGKLVLEYDKQFKEHDLQEQVEAVSRKPKIKKVIIADDDAIMRKLVNRCLSESGGYEVIEAKNGRDALVAIQQNNPDLILLDAMMPEMNGFEVCRQIRTSKKYARLPVIMLTALEQKKDIMKGFEAGVDDYISKPFDSILLLARLNAFFRRL